MLKHFLLLLPLVTPISKPKEARPQLSDQAPLYLAVTRYFLGTPALGLGTFRFACIGLNPPTGAPAQEVPDAPPSLIKYLRGDGLAVEKRSDCSWDYDIEKSRVHGKIRAGGAFLTLGPVHMLGANRAEVDVGYCCWAGWGTLILERHGSEWVVTSPKEWHQS